MRKYSEQICQKLESILCDICGESCKKEANNEVASLYAHWGYDSKKDLINRPNKTALDRLVSQKTKLNTWNNKNYKN